MRRWILLIIMIVGCLPWSAQAFTLDGNLIQGGMAIGKVEPGTRVRLAETEVRVSSEGLFVIGFARKAPATMTIELISPSGLMETRNLAIEKRTYDIQRIDGVPPRKVTPPKEEWDRIAAEQAMVKKVRRMDTTLTSFAQKFIWPVTGRISGVFGSQRVFNGQPRRPHSGVDIAAPTGTPVKAAADGVVTLVHTDMFFSGGTLIVDHGHGLATTYLHLHKTLVKEGQAVQQGDVIGQVGATGRVTGPHLHWSLNWFDTRLDPALLVPPMPKPPAKNAATSQ